MLSAAGLALQADDTADAAGSDGADEALQLPSPSSTLPRGAVVAEARPQHRQAPETSRRTAEASSDRDKGHGPAVSCAQADGSHRTLPCRHRATAVARHRPAPAASAWRSDWEAGGVQQNRADQVPARSTLHGSAAKQDRSSCPCGSAHREDRPARPDAWGSANFAEEPIRAESPAACPPSETGRCIAMSGIRRSASVSGNSRSTKSRLSLTNAVADVPKRLASKQLAMHCPP